MARRTKVVEIEGNPEENRDAGKRYLVTEMSPWDAESWAFAALNVIASSGIDVPPEAMRGGMAGLASVAPGFLSSFRGIDVKRAQPLLDEMKKQFSRLEAGNGIAPFPRALNEAAGDVEEITTILKLRAAFIELHLGFSLAGLLQRWSASLEALISQTTTSTSPASSGSSSAPGSQPSTS